MKIRVVCYEDIDGWICGKIAKRLAEGLVALGHDTTIAKQSDPTADVNHHVLYLNYTGATSGLHTLMVTHIDNATKLRRLQQGLQTARAAVCMSREGMQRLISLGVDRERVQFAHMAHDGKAIERRYTVGLSTRLYPDARKRESELVELLDHISPSDFNFKIMGFGWAPIVATMRLRGYEVEYHQDFHYENYIRMLSVLDYYLYMGEDEGSAAFIDALAAGVKTIVRPQGFHLDADNGITHRFTSFDELKQVFAGIAAEKQTRVNAVRQWTWENYARKHAQIWERCLERRSLHEAAGDQAQSEYAKKNVHLKAKLWINGFRQWTRMLLNLNKDYECGSRFWNIRKKRSELKK